MGISSPARWLAFLLLTAVTLCAAYLTSNLRVGGEHPLATAAARQVPLAESVGEAIVCRFSAAWDIPCPEPPDLSQWGNVPELAQMDFSVRYLCPIYRDTESLGCADKFLIGVAGIAIGLATIVIVVLLVWRCWRSRDRDGLVALVMLHAIGEVGSVALIALLWRARLPAIWMGGLSSESIGRSNVLGFTGDMIGYCLMVALAAISLIGVAAGTIRLLTRR